MTDMTPDLLLIQRIQSDLAFATDAGRWDDFLSCFVPEAQADYGSLGVGPIERLVGLIQESQGRYLGTMNLVGTHRASIDGARASAETYVLSHHFRVDEGRSWDDQAGTHYVDELTRTADGWRVSRRTAHLRWFRSIPSESGWL
jgi:hypothetical protein